MYVCFAFHDINNPPGLENLTIKEDIDSIASQIIKNPECNCCHTQITRFVSFMLLIFVCLLFFYRGKFNFSLCIVNLFNYLSRGPFITALGKIWCPEHFICTNEKCKRPLQDIGFVEEDNGLYCEYCFEQYLAPVCNKCSKKIKGVNNNHHYLKMPFNNEIIIIIIFDSYRTA